MIRCLQSEKQRANKSTAHHLISGYQNLNKPANSNQSYMPAGTLLTRSKASPDCDTCVDGHPRNRTMSKNQSPCCMHPTGKNSSVKTSKGGYAYMSNDKIIAITEHKNEQSIECYADTDIEDHRHFSVLESQPCHVSCTTIAVWFLLLSQSCG